MTERRRIPAPDLSKVEFAVGGPDPARRPRKGARERDKTAKAFDKLVQSAHDLWVKAGKPADFDDCPLGHAYVAAGEVESAQAWLRKSAQYFRWSMRYGVSEQLDDGRIDLAFVVRDLKE